MSRDKKTKKEDADFELEADNEHITEPTIDLEQEMAVLPSQEDTTQPEQNAGNAKPPSGSSRAANRASSNFESQRIDLEKAAPVRSREEKKSYKEKTLPPTSQEIYHALKKPDGFGFARKVMLVAILAAAFFYGQRFWQRTKELVPFPNAPVTNSTASDGKSISGHIEEVKNALIEKEEAMPVLVDAFIESDLVDIQVFVNGKNIAVAGQKFPLEAGKSYVIELKRNGYSDYRTEVIPEEGKPVKIEPRFQQEVASGFLTIETTPESKLTIYRDNQIVHEGSTPMSGFKVPAGNYKVVIENQLIGYRTEEAFTIYKSVTTNIRKELQAK